MELSFHVLSEYAEFAYKCSDFYHPGDDGGIDWNDPEIGIQWPQIQGEYPGSGSIKGYSMIDGTPLNINERDQNWGTLDQFRNSADANINF